MWIAPRGIFPAAPRTPCRDWLHKQELRFALRFVLIPNMIMATMNRMTVHAVSRTHRPMAYLRPSRLPRMFE